MSENLLYRPSDTELAWAKAIRAQCVYKIKQMDAEDAAKVLGIAVPGVTSLLWFPTWNISRCLRVADALEIDVLFVVERVQRVP